MSECLPPPGRRCGLHLAVAFSPAARVTRCACGTFHVHLTRQRVTLKMHLEELRHLGNALSAAARAVDHAEDPDALDVDAPPTITRTSGPLN
jgi:hypothetical protein